MPKPNKKYIQKDKGSYQSKQWSYEALGPKIADAQKTAPMFEYLV